MKIKNILFPLLFIGVALFWFFGEEADAIPPTWQEASMFFWRFWFYMFLFYLYLYWLLRYRSLPLHFERAEEFFLRNSDSWHNVGVGLFWILLVLSIVPVVLDPYNFFYLAALVAGMAIWCPGLVIKFLHPIGKKI